MRNQQPKQFLMDLYQNYVPKMRYDGAEPVEQWQEKAREKLGELLGLEWMVPCDPDFAVEGVKEYEDFVQTRFTFQSEPGYYVVCYLRMPKGVESCPPIICIQGHSKGQHLSLGEPKYPGDWELISDGDRDFCRHALANGFAAVTMDQRYMGENGGTPTGPSCAGHPENAINALPTLLYGRCAIGERVWDVMNLITVLGQQFPQLQMDKVACMGNSGGGTTTIYAGAMDPRIRFVMPSCAVCTYRDSIINMDHCACNYVPGIARYFDMAELCGMVAPRKLVIVAGAEDPIFPKDGVRATYEEAAKVFAAAGVPDRIRLVMGEQGHRFYAKAGYGAYKDMK